MTDGPGRLIAVCGIDASGKTTQVDLLAARLQSEGFTPRVMSFPRYGEGFFGDLIQRYLRGEFAANAADVSPYLASLPYACDRWEAAPRLREWLDASCTVLCNRYVPANLAHQGSKMATAAEREAFRQWDERLEYDVFRLPRPDLHILLDVAPEAAARLVRQRNAANGTPDGTDIHERDIAHLEATAAAYREIAASGAGRWAVIRCVDDGELLPRETIADSVWAEVHPILYNAEGQV